jgi:hypothetical protein
VCSGIKQQQREEYLREYEERRIREKDRRRQEAEMKREMYLKQLKYGGDPSQWESRQRRDIDLNDIIRDKRQGT